MKKLHVKISVFSAVCFLFLLAYSFVLVYPFLWGICTSFKSITDFTKNPIGLPETWIFSNYVTAFEYFYVQLGPREFVYIEEMALYSILYAGGCAFVQTLSACVVAYATAKFNFRFSKIVYSVVLVTLVLPIVGSLPSEIQMTVRLGIYDTMLGAWILKANFLGMYYLVFYASFRGISPSFSEAAKIDGASNRKILTSIMLPLVKGTFFTIMLINFVAYWNDYQTPLVYIPSYPTLAYGLYRYNFSTLPEISDTPMKLAGCMIVFIPIFIVFVCFQKQLIGNISMGGVKE